MVQDIPRQSVQTGLQTKEQERGIVKSIAHHFSAGLLRAIGRESIREVNKRNAVEEGSGVCHSHDFVDANEVMADAFREVMGRDIRLPCEVDEGLHTQEESNADCRLWNEAWSLAAREGFESPQRAGNDNHS